MTLGLESLVFAFALVAGIALGAVYSIVRWRRAVRIMNTRVLIGEAMQRQGVTPADAEAAGLEAELFAARGRCADCADAQSCRVLLSESRSPRLPDDCPNRPFFAWVATEKRVLDVSSKG